MGPSLVQASVANVTMKLLVALSVCVGVASAYITYQDLIPNGASVPDPCTNGIWNGVGHIISFGTGARNQFGKDFANAGHDWTKPCAKWTLTEMVGPTARNLETRTVTGSPARLGRD